MTSPLTIFPSLAVVRGSPSAYFLGNALAILTPDSQEKEIQTFTENLRRVIRYAQQKADIGDKPSCHLPLFKRIKLREAIPQFDRKKEV